MQPVVTRDPRFCAGRKLVQQGKADEGGIDMFAVLVEEARQKFGEEGSIEVAPTYYEYGNALLRAALRSSSTSDQEAEAAQKVESDRKHNDDARKAAAEAAEKRMKSAKVEDQEDSKPAALEKSEKKSSETIKEENDKEPETVVSEEAASEPEESGDLTLALEMMENSYAIMDEYQSSDDSENSKYKTWVSQQIPRVLLGLGDCLSALDRHGDAADAYSRALEIRQAELEKFKKNDMTIEHLQAHRRVCEATVLIAEELLACPPDEDVVTTETNTLVVSKAERIEYARGYYEKSRDALQEAVFCMGSVAAKNVDVSSEKEDICFVATMVMGVGTSLQEIDDAAAEKASADEPPTKKQKK